MGHERVMKIQKEFREEFYLKHPEKRPAKVEMGGGVTNTFTLRTENDVDELADVLKTAIQKFPLVVRVMRDD